MLKRRGLSIFGKYCRYNAQDDLLLYFEEKTKLIPPSATIHLYADKNKEQEILVIKDNKHQSEVDFDVIDVASGDKVGGLSETAENLSDFVLDTI